MRVPVALWSGVGVLALVGAGFAAWIASLPPTPVAAAPLAVPELETRGTVRVLAPLKLRSRPLVAVIGVNEGTETTDYLMPYGILKRADVADVVALSTKPGPMTLFPALRVEPEATIAEFERRHPEGADYVIVPAMHRDDEPDVLAWLRHQRAKGATIIGVCAGAKVVAAAGLLDGRRATTHWYYRDQMRKRHPTIQLVPDRRFVMDAPLVTTTGVSASMPFSLTLIEAIAGREKAEAVAIDLGLAEWDARHASAAFGFTRPFALTAMGNTLAFWRRERLGIVLTPGIDEVSLALVADAWSRTFRSRAVTFAAAADSQPTRTGLRVIPDRIATRWPADRLLPVIEGRPAAALDQALAGIATRLGPATADVVAMQLEYDRSRPATATNSQSQ